MFGFGENKKLFGAVVRGIILLVIYLCASAVTLAQSFSLKGQLWSSVIHGDDPPVGRSSFETTLGYIPMLSLAQNLPNDRFVDLEWGYRTVSYTHLTLPTKA